MTMPLGTEPGMAEYHWYRDGNPVCGNSASCEAAESGFYTVTVTAQPGCTGTSAEFPVDIHACPFVEYLSSSAPYRVPSR